MPIIHCTIPGYEGTYDINGPYLAEFLEISNMPSARLQTQPWTIITPNECVTFQHVNCNTPPANNVLYDNSPEEHAAFNYPECTICWLSDVPPNALINRCRIPWHQHAGPRAINMTEQREVRNPILGMNHHERNPVDLLRMIQEIFNSPDDN